MRSVWLSVKGWKAEDSFGSILRRWHRCFQKWDVKWVPWSEMRLLRSPCSFQTESKYSFATSSECAVVWHGRKCVILVRRFTMTKIASNPLLTDNPLTKSIEMSCQGCLGIGNGRRTPWGAWWVALLRLQLWQFLTYRSTYWYIFGR